MYPIITLEFYAPHTQLDDNRPAGEVHLRDQVAVRHQAVGGLGQDGVEELPRQHAGQHEQRIPHPAVRRQPGDSAEDEGEDDDRAQRPNDRPRHAEKRLLVVDGDIPPGQEEQQFAMPQRSRQ